MIESKQEAKTKTNVQPRNTALCAPRRRQTARLACCTTMHVLGSSLPVLVCYRMFTCVHLCDARTRRQACLFCSSIRWLILFRLSTTGSSSSSVCISLLHPTPTRYPSSAFVGHRHVPRYSSLSTPSSLVCDVPLTVGSADPMVILRLISVPVVDLYSRPTSLPLLVSVENGMWLFLICTCTTFGWL